MSSADRDPSGRRLPKWKADELFKAIADVTRLESSQQGEGNVIVDTRREVHDPFAGPHWPRWYAQGPEDLLDEDDLGYRMILMIFLSLFGFTFMIVALTLPLAVPVLLVLLPVAFVKLIGRHALPYSKWNVVFWTLYLGGYFVFLLFS